jgi:CRP-like cAMP-binding protein
MISPELLRRFPFFGGLNDAQLREIAMISEEIETPSGTQIFGEQEPANAIYLLLQGGIELTYKSEEEYHPKTRKIFSVGDISPGEMVGISALIEPYKYSAAARTSSNSKILKLDGVALRSLIDGDAKMGCELIHQVAKIALERLASTRVQLAAAWA